MPIELSEPLLIGPFGGWSFNFWHFNSEVGHPAYIMSMVQDSRQRRIELTFNSGPAVLPELPIFTPAIAWIGLSGCLIYGVLC